MTECGVTDAGVTEGGVTEGGVTEGAGAFRALNETGIKRRPLGSEESRFEGYGL